MIWASLVVQVVKTLASPGLIPESEKSTGEGHGDPLQYSCLENPMDRGYSPWGLKELDMTEQLILWVDSTSWLL